jgi:serine phosphatase RsbU (regulator of sigma subunit)
MVENTTVDLVERFGMTLGDDLRVLPDVRAYAAWRMGRAGEEFVPRPNDDVELRTYLLHLRSAGAEPDTVRHTIDSLRRFYGWAFEQGKITSNPFDEYDFNRPILSRDQVRRRQQTYASSSDRELAHLRALNRLSEELNRSLDVRSILSVALKQVLDAMDLKTAWAFLRVDSDLASFISDTPKHEFVLAAAVGLPPGLEREERFYLRKPPACHCQSLLLSGRLKRAVNIVECSRLQSSALAAGDNESLLFHASVPLVVQGQTVGILNYATEEYQFLTGADLQLLSAVGMQVSTALERARLYDLAETQRARLAVELEMARAVQSSLLPESLPEIPGFDLAAHWWFAHEVGGDFCDIFPLPGGRWGIVVADVSDKGAPAALYMSMTRGLLRSYVDQANSPGVLLSRVNHALMTLSSSAMFVTLFYAVVDPKAQTISYANAGQNPPILRRADGRVEELTRTGIALGVLDDKTWEDQTVHMAPGDSLVAYTDGVTDAMNPRGESYGSERLTSAILAAPAGARAVIDQVVAGLKAFTEGAPLADDLTLFVLEKQ